jgi:long-chain acyl-CoA synthetase
LSRTVPTAPSPETAAPRAAVASLAELALRAAERHRGDALTVPGAPPTSFAELGRAVREIAAGLAALGVRGGDRVGLLAGTVPEWTLADFGALCAGAVVVPIYHTNSPEECRYVLDHAGVRVLLCEDAAQAAKVARVRAELPELEHVVVLRGTAEAALTLAELRERGAADGGVVDARVAAIGREDAATIVYTSGTTGPPKGCVLTHANLLAAAGMYTERLGLREAQPVIYLYLPLAHALARIAEIVSVDTGGTLAFWGGDPSRIREELAEIRPTHFPTVPRVLEKIHAAALTAVESAGPLRQGIFRRALATATRVRVAERAGGRAAAAARARHALGDRLVLSRIRAVFGDRLANVLTGAAPIGREVLEFLDACGVLVLEGYGMTETCAAATLNTPAERRLGTVGRPLPGTGVEIAPDGEVRLRGPNVFAGYHHDLEATAAVLEGGWVATGDLGEVDAAGYLTITGRKKDLIITSSGKNVSPENLESALRETRWISHAVVAGDRRSYLIALVTLDPDEAPRLAEQLGVAPEPAAMARDDRVREAVWRDIEAVNQRFARVEQVKRFVILPRDLSQAEGELTPTLKVKRAFVYDRYAGEIDALYGS